MDRHKQVERALWLYEMRSGEAMKYGTLALCVNAAEAARMQLRHAVIMEGANVSCELVRDGGGT